MENNSKLYERDSYLWEFTAEVTDCLETKAGYEILLTSSYFYPEGGGQPADWGTLEEANVLDVQEKEGLVIHITDQPLPIGKTVLGKIDAKRRYRHMQHHTAEHILSGIVKRELGFDNVGFHMGSDCITIDFNGKLSEADSFQIEAIANEAVRKNITVKSYYPEPEELRALSYRSKKELTGAVRIVEIPEIDICACCATHVKKTGEIGLIKLFGAQNYKGGTRICMVCANQAVEYCQMLQKEMGNISNLFSAKIGTIAEAAERLLKEKEQLKNRVAALQNHIFHMEAEKLSNRKNAIVIEKNLESIEIKNFAALLAKERDGIAAVFSLNDKGVYQYVLFGGKEDAREIGERLKEAFSGKGGGSKEMVQGSIAAKKEDIQAFFAKWE